MRLRGMSTFEIVDALAGIRPYRDQPIIVNPETKLPYTKSTIGRDIQHLEERWRTEALKDIAELKGNQLAELREARRRAWGQQDMSEVRQNLVTEMKLLGTPEPDKVQHSGNVIIFGGIAPDAV